MNTNPTIPPEERERIIEEHLPLVRYVVRKMHVVNPPAGLEFDDLVSHGTLGLIQAVDRFDGSQGGLATSFLARAGGVNGQPPGSPGRRVLARFVPHLA